MRNPGIKPEDKEWLWGEIPSASPQAPGTNHPFLFEEVQEEEIKKVNVGTLEL